ncbi:MAG: metallophosphoesterase [Candidatus Methanomethylicaceae archaeon]
MNILAISDIHGREDVLKAILDNAKSFNIKAISISGDITNFGNYEDLERILKILENFGVPFFYVLGNCDPINLRNGIESLGICLESKCYNLFGYNIIGSGGSTPTPFNTPFEISEEELISNLKKAYSICKEITMILTHNPPFGSIVDKVRSGVHVGSKTFREFIIFSKPKIVQCGHIHEARGKEIIGNTIVFNPGPAMRGYYAIVSLENLEVKLSSL